MQPQNRETDQPGPSRTSQCSRSGAAAGVVPGTEYNLKNIIQNTVKETISELGLVNSAPIRGDLGRCSSANSSGKQEPSDKLKELFSKAYEMSNSAPSGVRCYVCSRSVVDDRYKCVVCFDYDLCDKCYQVSTHSANHPFIFINLPTTQQSRVRVVQITRSHQPRQLLRLAEQTQGKVALEEEQTSTKHILMPSVPPDGIPLKAASSDQSLVLRSTYNAKGDMHELVPKAYPPNSRMAGAIVEQFHCTMIRNAYMYTFYVRNSTASTWSNMSLESKGLFQSYFKIIDYIYVMDWSLPTKALPGELAEVVIILKFDNVDGPLYSNNIFHQSWALKVDNNYLADLQCLIHFDDSRWKSTPSANNRYSSKTSKTASSSFSFFPKQERQSGPLGPGFDSAILHLSEQLTRSANKLTETFTRTEDSVRLGGRERRYNIFKPPCFTPNSTPAGSMSPKSPADVVDESAAKSGQSIPSDATTSMLPQHNNNDNGPHVSNGATSAILENSSAQDNDKANETKNESFTIIQHDEPGPSKPKVGSNKEEKSASLSSENNYEYSSALASPVIKSLEVPDLGQESDDSDESEALSSDYVVVKLPKCFDLDAPFAADAKTADDGGNQAQYPASASPAFIIEDVPSEAEDDLVRFGCSSDSNHKVPDKGLTRSAGGVSAEPTRGQRDSSPIRSQPVPIRRLYPSLNPRLDHSDGQEQDQHRESKANQKSGGMSRLRSFIITHGDDDSEASDQEHQQQQQSDHTKNINDSGIVKSGDSAWYNSQTYCSTKVHTCQPITSTGNLIEIPSAPMPDGPETATCSMLSNLTKLDDMGFGDRELNGSLLLKHNQDLDAVLGELLSQFD